MITWKWRITFLNKRDSINEFQDVVSRIYWEIVLDDNGVESILNRGYQAFNLPQDDTFIPYADLTEQECIDWVKKSLGEAHIAYEAEATQTVIRLQGNQELYVGPDQFPWNVN